MSSKDIAISVRGLSKSYTLTHNAEKHDSLRDAVKGWLKSPRRRAARETFWALKDVEFDIREGDVVGIIGRNGAGKSTLLKVLSRITEPTTGKLYLYGRVGSLLEVGTGFHPELTGRENIYLNGAILGMRRWEIDRHFDAIVDFAGVEKFLDTPVKRYSSGMYVRLAFGVAAHLEPEILIVDEVLAVGDAAFQKKCLGKMGDVAKEGRTVLFVSHNMDAVRRLCTRAIWMDGGKIRTMGDTACCLSEYLLREVRESGKVVFDPPHQMANGMPILLRSVHITDQVGTATTHFSARSAVRVDIEWESYAPLYKPRIGFVLQTVDGLDVLTALDANSWADEWLPSGRRISSCAIPGGLLNEGEYVIDVGADGNPGRPDAFDFTRSRTGAILRFDVEDDMTLSNKYYGQEGFRDSRWPGVLLLNLPWTQEHISQEERSNDLIGVGA